MSVARLLLPALLAALPCAAAAQDAGDPFANVEALVMDEAAMRDASGGSAAYALDLDPVRTSNTQTNTAGTTGTISGSTVTDAVTGGVVGNVVSANSGITTVFINTGNNVVMQSTVQVNVYAPAGL